MFSCSVAVVVVEQAPMATTVVVAVAQVESWKKPFI
jgi:hypothetical protein